MYQYKVNFLRVVDGDTFDVDIELGFGVILNKQRIRLKGIDTWESRTRNLEEKKKGLQAKEFTKEMLCNSEEILIDSYGKGKYGRVLAEVWCDGISLNEQLLQNGHAYHYDGGKKKEFK